MGEILSPFNISKGERKRGKKSGRRIQTLLFHFLCCAGGKEKEEGQQAG